MNEQTITDREDVVESGAPAQPSSDTGATAQSQDSDAYSPDELRSILEDSLKSHWSGVDRVITKDRERVAQLEDAVTQLLGESKRTSALLERVVQGTMTEEDWNRLQFEETKQRADRAEAALAEKTKPAPTEEPKADAQTLLNFELERYHLPALQRHAQRRGLRLDETTAKAMGLLNSNGQWRIERGKEGADANDPYGWHPFLAEAEGLIDAYADKIGLVKEPAVEIDDTRAGGVAGGDARAYKAWLEGKGPQPPAAVIDRLTHPFLTRA